MNYFVTTFWTKKEDLIITAVDQLIDELLPEKREWNIHSLLNYLDIVYRSVLKTKSPEDECAHPKWKNITSKNTHKKYYFESKYIIFNTGLLYKNNEKIYFAIETEENKKTETNKYFYTENELKNLDNNFKGVNSVVEILRDSFIGIIKDLDKIDIEHNTEDTRFNYEDCNKIKEEIDKVEKEKDCNYPKKKDIKKRLADKNYYSGPGWSHIIIDGSDNLPLPIINALFNESYLFCEKGNIRYQIMKEENRYDSIKGLLIRALNRSLLKAKRNITLIAPTLYPGKIDDNKELGISYIIPLYLMHSNKPDCVFLFNREGNNDNYKYVGKTLLNMEEASLNIRAFGNTEQYSWLEE